MTRGRDIAAVLLISCGCSDAGSANDGLAGTAETTDATASASTSSGSSASSGDTATGSAAATASTDGSDSATGPVFDVGAVTSGTGGHRGCTFVDILFVIDNSPSMGQYQQQLAFAFPTFVDAMWKNLAKGTDLHVGITTTSFFNGGCAESTLNCATAQTAREVLAHYLTPDIGNTGVNGEQGRLYEHEGKRYFATAVGGDPWPLKTWFAEAATAAGEVGCSYEMMTAAASYPFHSANGVHNAGFLRDEGAVLVIFVLTDEPDKSPEMLSAYKDLITAAKSGCGGENCVIAAGIVDTCVMNVNNILWQFLGAWPEPPFIGDIEDAAGYSDVIGSALADVIGQKCDDIPPAG